MAHAALRLDWQVEIGNLKKEIHATLGERVGELRGLISTALRDSSAAVETRRLTSEIAELRAELLDVRAKLDLPGNVASRRT